MFNSGILDVAVGLIFVYLILSLISTGINEMIEIRIKKRSADLHRGIREMLHDKDGTDWAKKLYNHPLIYNLFQGEYDSTKTKDLPSYIPARNFALALMDLVMSPPSSTPSSSTAQSEGGASVLASLPRADKQRSLQDANNAMPASSSTSDSTPAQPEGGASVLASLPRADKQRSLQDAINAMPNTEVRRALLALANEAENDTKKLRKNLEDWFDSTMERVSGWYTRRVRVITLFVGLAVAVVFNADSIAIGNSLSYDVSMRNSLVAAAQEYAKENTSLPVSANQQSEIAACQQNENSPECRIAKNLNELQKLGLPIGWNMEDPRTVPTHPLAWITKGLGWLLTAFAISLGAPFWFDLLNKIIIVRSTVRPKEKSPDEPPLDAKKSRPSFVISPVTSNNQTE